MTTGAARRDTDPLVEVTLVDVPGWEGGACGAGAALSAQGGKPGSCCPAF